MTPVLVEREALEDASDAYDWYEERREGLGERFRDALGDAIARIAENPAQFPVHYRDLRRVILFRFPYAVYYRVDSNHASVVAVFHGKRSPKALQSR